MPLDVPGNPRQHRRWKVQTRLINLSRENTARPNQATALHSIVCPAVHPFVVLPVAFASQPFRDVGTYRQGQY